MNEYVAINHIALCNDFHLQIYDVYLPYMETSFLRENRHAENIAGGNAINPDFIQDNQILRLDP